jgi:hypothetical protein
MNQRRHPDPYMQMLFDQFSLVSRLMPERRWTVQRRMLGYFDGNNQFHPYDGFNLELRRENIKTHKDKKTREI